MKDNLLLPLAVGLLCGALGCGMGTIGDPLDGSDPAAGGDGAVDPAGDPAWGDGELQCEGTDVGPSELRRLTRKEYDNTVRDLLGVTGRPAMGFTPDEKIGGFNSNANVPVSELAVEQFMDAAESIARQATAGDRLGELLPCDIGGDERACAREFVEGFGRRAYRRPLSAEEAERLMGVYDDLRTTHEPRHAVRVVVQTMLQSPHFLYHVELDGQVVEGTDGQIVRLGPWAMASRLSYFLWNSMPDAPLMAAAERGELQTREQVEAQARRMLADPRAREALSSFHLQWLDIEHLEHLEKDADVYPGFDEATRHNMLGETEAFVEHVIQQGDGRLETLLTADYSFINYPLAELYGVEGVERPSETWHFEAETVGSDVGGAAGSAWNVWSPGRLVVTVEAPAPGLYRVGANVWGDQAGGEPVKMAMGADGVAAQTFEVDAADPSQAEVFMVEVQVDSAGAHTFFVEFLNDYYDPDVGHDRNLLVDWVEVAGPFGGGGLSLDDSYTKTPMDPAQRSGILTHASVLSTHAKANQSSPVHRGKFIRERMLCQTLPPPPNDVEIVPPELDDSLSTRERFARHSEDPACRGCHLLMDPIGVGFEHYDGVGRYRDSEGGAPIDATGEVLATEDLNGEFDGVVELSQKLADSEEVKRCVATQWFRFAIRRLEAEADLCSLASAYEAFAEADYDIRELLVALAISDSFRHRRRAAP